MLLVKTRKLLLLLSVTIFIFWAWKNNQLQKELQETRTFQDQMFEDQSDRLFSEGSCLFLDSKEDCLNGIMKIHRNMTDFLKLHTQTSSAFPLALALMTKNSNAFKEKYDEMIDVYFIMSTESVRILKTLKERRINISSFRFDFLEDSPSAKITQKICETNLNLLNRLTTKNQTHLERYQKVIDLLNEIKTVCNEP